MFSVRLLLLRADGPVECKQVANSRGIKARIHKHKKTDFQGTKQDYELMNEKQLAYCAINQYRKCSHRDVASTVQIITVHKIQNSKQLLNIKKVVIARKQQKTDVN